jgi:hypothetical protein
MSKPSYEKLFEENWKLTKENVLLKTKIFSIQRDLKLLINRETKIKEEFKLDIVSKELIEKIINYD